jgi:hypothetical protein
MVVPPEVVEKVVRDAVYNNNKPRTASPNKDFYSILLVPDSLTEAYKKHPQAVLGVLLRIMDGGNPNDSVLAAGYAISLLRGPGVGIVCIRHFDKETYDTVDKDWEVTPRQHWIKRVRQE